MADRFHNIVVGIDFSPFCKTALSQALRLARRDGASLHVVHVMDSLILDDLRQALRNDTDQFEQEVRDQTRERLDEFVHETAQG
ncbi:universal stress protein, partial [Candidatus Sumerlaeota bacterium]|nr:universal stress protein [Candidatus Sumerlaeota bacterium]